MNWEAVRSKFLWSDSKKGDRQINDKGIQNIQR